MPHDQNAWIDDHGAIVEFAQVLLALDVFETPKDAVYFFEKPWKWTPEHERWLELGKPSTLESIEQLQAGLDERAVLVPPAARESEVERLGFFTAKPARSLTPPETSPGAGAVRK